MGLVFQGVNELAGITDRKDGVKVSKAVKVIFLAGDSDELVRGHSLLSGGFIQFAVFSHAEPFGDLPGMLRAAGQLLVTQVAGVLDLLFRLAGDLRKAQLSDQARSLLGVIGLLLLAVAFGAEGVIALGPLFPAVGLGAIPAVVGVFDEGLSALFGGR